MSEVSEEHIEQFETFFKEFRDDEGSFKWRDRIERMPLEESRSLIIDFNDVRVFDPVLAELAEENPERFINAASTAVKNVMKGIDPDYYKKVDRFHARFRNPPEKLALRKIRAVHIGKFVQVEGILTRASEVKPLLIKAMFICTKCGYLYELPQDKGYTEPKICENPSCRKKGPFKLLMEESTFTDWQKIRIQEMPEELPPGQLPRSLDVIIQDDLVDTARPGDRVGIIGILRSVPDFTRGRLKTPTFSVYLESNNVDVFEKGLGKIEISPEEEQEIKTLSKDVWVHQKLIRSIAPSIYGYENIKEAIALLLFGGSSKVLPDGMKIRGESNILLVGDPGTAKSVHGTEKIFVGRPSECGIAWTTETIAEFIDGLIENHKDQIISNGDTEILFFDDGSPFYTQSLDPVSMKVRKSKVTEISRHQTTQLVHIHTRSGRTVIATPDHSFTTIIDGWLQVIKAQDLHAGTYLPIARNIQLNSELPFIDLYEEYSKDKLVSTEVINTQISLVKSGTISARKAAKTANVTPNTMGDILQNKIKIPKGSWLRRKFDTTWFPRWLPLDSALGRIIGLYLAEGNVEGTTVRFTNRDRSIREMLKKDLEKVFGKASTFKQGVLLCQSSLSKWFKQNFGTGADFKQIDGRFFATPSTFRRSLLSGYFSGDGTIDKRGSAVTSSTTSKNLAYQICDMLSTLGIFATIKKKTITSDPYQGREYYLIRVQGIDAIKYCEEIGFVSSTKQTDLEELVERLTSRKRYQSRDIIPNFDNLLKNATKELEIHGPRGSNARNFLAELRGKKYRQRIGRIYLQKVVSRLQQMASYDAKSYSLEWLKSLAESDIFWDPITKIECINQQAPVYDIGTDDGHFILAEGNLITHNSQLLQYVARISPRALYTSGKGSTAAGLTAAVLRDTDTGEMTLEAGALVLSDMGVACIDEFDKMRPEDRAAIHEAMEQHTISIAKAGIVATLNARTSILAAANPSLGRYNSYKTPAENIKLPVTILSRFDLMFVLQDKPEEELDRAIAAHILKLHKKSDEAIEAPISPTLLRKYIAYAKQRIHPRLTPEAAEKIEDFYLKLRKAGESANAPVPITARQLEALVRLSESRAKMALREGVSIEDAEATIRLMKYSLQQVGVDESGRFDIDSIMLGQTKSTRDKIGELLDLIRALEHEMDGAVPISKLINRAEEAGFEPPFVKRAIDNLQQSGEIYEPKSGFIKRISEA